MQIIVASTNPVKIQAVKSGFSNMFPDEDLQITGISVPSGVSDQPMTKSETQTGAVNRAVTARSQHPHADYWVGLEGGVCPDGEDLISIVSIVVASPHRLSHAEPGTFLLPPRITQLIKAGKELGEADDEVFGGTNTKQKNGAVGILTRNVVDRATHYERGVVLALIPFINPGLYPDST